MFVTCAGQDWLDISLCFPSFFDSIIHWCMHSAFPSNRTNGKKSLVFSNSISSFVWWVWLDIFNHWREVAAQRVIDLWDVNYLFNSVFERQKICWDKYTHWIQLEKNLLKNGDFSLVTISESGEIPGPGSGTASLISVLFTAENWCIIEELHGSSSFLISTLQSNGNVSCDMEFECEIGVWIQRIEMLIVRLLRCSLFTSFLIWFASVDDLVCEASNVSSSMKIQPWRKSVVSSEYVSSVWTVCSVLWTARLMTDSVWD